jgi:hypothetical protein
VPKFCLIMGHRAPKLGLTGLKSGPIMSSWRCESEPIMGHGVGPSLDTSCVHADHEVAKDDKNKTTGNIHNIVLKKNAPNL